MNKTQKALHVLLKREIKEIEGALSLLPLNKQRGRGVSEARCWNLGRLLSCLVVAKAVGLKVNITEIREKIKK